MSFAQDNMELGIGRFNIAVVSEGDETTGDLKVQHSIGILGLR